MKKTFDSFSRNIDPKDPEYLNLLEVLRKKFKERNIEELSGAEMQALIVELVDLRKKINELNDKDERLGRKYNGDAKFVRIHKRALNLRPPLADTNPVMCAILTSVKSEVDDAVSGNRAMLDNQAYFTKASRRMIIDSCKAAHVVYSADQVRDLAELVSAEYIEERRKAS